MTLILRFNPRVLAGGRDRYYTHYLPVARFQSTRPRGRTRRARVCAREIVGGFNPRVLAGGRDVITHWFPVILCFNPRVLAGGRDYGLR